jgi:hypothetical protein
MKKAVVKIGKTGKRITGILGFVTAIFAVWGIIKNYSTKDVTGEWYIEFKVNKSAYKPYLGESHTQKVYFVQNSSGVTGDGEKWKYNGKYLPAEMHRKIEYTGVVDGDELNAKYILHGEKRVSSGNIKVKISDNSMTGTFSGTAGESSGTVHGTKSN